ncbi:MAG: Tn3 family transposase [Planctomycetaceae bacterium]|nr:Tn3 family transposase [Planctomycetaceae bacterium]
MPVDFLTAEQQRRYGRYASEPSPAQLDRYFHLDDADREVLRTRRGDHNRLGFAVQLGTVRFLGTFLDNPIDVPDVVIAHVARQLAITDLTCLTRYGVGETHWDHLNAIKAAYGYRDFSDQPGHSRLIRWLYARAWVSAERPSLLFDLATAWLVERKVLLPGVTVLARVVAQARDRAAARLWRVLAAAPNAVQRERLEALLVVPEGARQSHLDRLRCAPTRVSGPALVAALRRLEEIRALGVAELDLSRIPAGRLKALARHAASSWAAVIARMPRDRRVATLLAFARTFEATALDDALDLLDLIVTDLLAQAKLTGEKERLRTLRDLDAAALQLREACAVLLDETCSAARIRSLIFARVSKQQLAKAVALVEALARPPEDDYQRELLDRYRRVRRFWPYLLQTITFQSTQAGRPLIQALRILAALEDQRESDLSQAPLDVVSRAWRRFVIGPDQTIDRRAYTLCVLHRLQDGLRRRDVFVDRSERWGDPRAKLLHGAAWEAARSQVCLSLGRQATAATELGTLRRQLDDAYRRTADNLPANDAVRIEKVAGRDTLTLTPLDRLDEPASLTALRETVAGLLPRVDLPDVLLEIQARTNFAGAFTHVSEGTARVGDLATSVCAVLLAEACNIGLEPLVRPDVPALTRGRLTWVQQNYVRAETLIRANAQLVDAQAKIPLAQAWGGGEVASADGLRFVVPVRSVNAGPNSKYFGTGRGITYYNFTSDQFTGFHGIVIPGTLRDSLFILEGLLEQQTSLRPLEIMADTAGASDVVFGLFWLLGYQFSPRLADIGEARFWRMDPAADYGALNGLARHRVNTDLIARNWDDLLRVAGSLARGTISASELIGSLLRSSRPATLTRAIGELGRVAKTLYLLSYVDDETYRRRILTQLNRGESRHGVARAIFHGQRGEVRQRYREGQEDQLGALGLVVNVVVLWNTLYMDAALAHLRHRGVETKPEDVARLSPLGHENINFLGRYSFALAESVARGELRPLHDPEEASSQAGPSAA